jgi:hypothetical protein
MTRIELREALKAKGILEVSGNKDPLWRMAFDLYYKETHQKLSPSCGSCYTRLRNWLKS